ncbi:MAG: nuclear transport factor 2 family protein [Sphingobacteriales bacterium JAD_PAG50586_3]|nr:MAG: nuclear transport factor 2 family protein [Sphingobacteriales bacterium JAD_PAG50586_3]
MKKITLSIVVLLFSLSANAQLDTNSTLYKTIKTCDSLLFTIGFNTCDISQFETLVSDKFEFYHDKSGITNTKVEFITSIKDGLCKMDYKPSRRLVAGSMEVFPLENNGVVYGVIQNGKHRFYALDKDEVTRLTSIARFTHLWLIENGKWKFSRGLSYDHINMEEK